MKTKLLLSGAALAIAFAVPAVAADPLKIGFITKFSAPYFSTMEEGGQAAADAAGVDIIFAVGDSATDIEGQIRHIESMVAQGVDGIAITPVDPTVASALDRAIDAGVKVVLMDNSIPDWGHETALATTNNYAAGVLAGQYLAGQLSDGAKIGLLEGVPGVPALDDRINGMLEGLGDLKYEIVGRGATGCQEEAGLNLAQDILTANPDVNAFYGACGAPTVGAGTAIKNAGISPDSVVVVGFDFCCGEAEALASGDEDATVAQFPYRMAQFGVDALVTSLRGGAVESLIDSGAALVTMDNIADF
jgi:ribose transport system substrate-binding protein